MIQKLESPQRAEALFGSWQDAILWACLQDVMGAVYADDMENPNSAMAMLGDFCFFAGKPDKEVALYKPESCRREFIIMIPQNDEWSDLIRSCYGEKAKAITRYAIKKEGDIFNRDKLREAVRSLRPGFELKMIDKESYDICRSQEWSRDLVSQFTEYQMYERLGIGVAAYKDGQLVSGASSYARYQNGIEIEIDTKEEYRRQGLAYACGAKLILECLERGLYPSWDAQNLWSVGLAEKLGYHFDFEYPAYEIYGYA